MNQRPYKFGRRKFLASAAAAVSDFDWSSPATVDWAAAEEFQSMAGEGIDWIVAQNASMG
jgi:hypothetical protein